MRKQNLSKTQTDLNNRLKDRQIEVNEHKYKDNIAQVGFWNDFELERA